MSEEGLTQHIEALQRQTATLRQRAVDGPTGSEALLSEALTMLQQQIFELQVNEEELRQQNEELAYTREGVEEERRRYQELFESVPDGYVVTDAQGVIQEVNRAAVVWLNRLREYLVGTPLAACVVEGDRRAFFTLLGRIRAGEEVGEPEVRFQPVSGTPLTAAVKVTILRDTQGAASGLRWLLRDITVRKQAEEALRQGRDELEQHVQERTAALRESEKKYHTLFDSIDEGFSIVEVLFDEDDRPRDFRFLETNPAFERQTGLTDAAGRRMRDLVPQHEDYWFEMYGNVAVTGEPARFEYPAAQLGCVYDGYAFRIGEPAERKVATLFKDIAERKQVEEERERLFKELQRINDELQQFAHIVSHDLNEPLRTMSNSVQLLERRLKGQTDADATEYMAFVVDAARRMQRMLTDLLAYTRAGQTPEFRATDCEAVLAQVLSALQTQITERGAVITHDPLPTVQSDATRLGQVLQNLIGNALKFCAAEPPRVHVWAERWEQTSSVRVPSPLEARGEKTWNGWRFAVRDNGIGIDPRQTGKLFHVFQRAHGKEYEGTGVGLAICKRIVEQHGGRIWVDSWLGEGSILYFTISDIRGGGRKKR